jgi:formate C-acetyltransferase
MAVLPRRLSEATHRLAERALSGEWARSLGELPLSLDDVPGLDDASDEARYACCVELIARHAPLRIAPGQRLVGSASLQLATFHQVPVRWHGEPAFASTSHVTLGFDRVLTVGYRGLREQIARRLARGNLDARGLDLLRAMRLCLDAASTWHERYLARLAELAAESTSETRAEYERVHANLRRVPEDPPETFYEAAQSLWFMFAFQRLCGNWPGIGRIDLMLGPYLRRDLEAGRITLEGAREVLAHFWVNGCEWVGAKSWSNGTSGDGQFYQNIVLGGVDADGREVTNEVTYLVLDVVEELRISDFPIAVRTNVQTPPSLLRRIAEVQRLGGGTVAVYNEELILRSLVAFGYSLEEARQFANDGCWEIQVPGKTNFIYRPFDTLALLQRTLGVTSGGEVPHFERFEDLYAAFRAALAEQVAAIHREADRHATSAHPSTLVSLFTEDCVERGRGYFDRGARYNVFAPHAGGLPDTGNSLYAIRRLVFDEKRLTLDELVQCMRQDWQGWEALRRSVLNGIEFYGNDNAETDAMTRRVFDDFLALVAAVHKREGVLRPAGVSTFGREIEWRPQRGATAHGHRAGETLATNFSPTPGTDRKGPTAVIRSHCAMGLERLPNGTALELKIHPTCITGEEGVDSLVSLIRAFVRLGGIYMHVDVVDNDTLRDAQAHPERYPNLAVRISGWSARFVTLSKEWQDMIISRTQQGP